MGAENIKVAANVLGSKEKVTGYVVKMSEGYRTFILPSSGWFNISETNSRYFILKCEVVEVDESTIEQF